MLRELPRPTTTAPSITEISIADVSTASFQYYDTKAGDLVDLCHACLSVSAEDSQTVTVNPDTAKKVVFITPPRTTPAGTASDPITVQRQDQFDNPNTADDRR